MLILFFQVPFSSDTLATSIYAVGVQVSSNTLVIRADSCGTGGFTWLNEEPTAIGDELKLSEDVTCKQTSVRQYICTDSSAFHLVVDMYEGHLSVQSWTSKCEDSRGLFGPCGSDGVFNDFLSSSGSSLDPNTDLNIKNIYEKFAASWQADNQNTMFSAVLPNYIPSSVEMCLQSTDGHAISEPVNTFTKANVSIEIKFYLEETVTGCATLWSYHSLETFSVLICDSYVNIYHNKQKTEMKKLGIVSAQTWYHLSTVWNGEASQLDMFLLLVSKRYKSDLSTDFSESPLIPGGQFMIGQMYYDSTMDLEVLSWNFNGYFDEFTIWKKPLDLNFIINNAFSYKIGTEEDLSTIWRFNEGYGTTSWDSSELRLKMEWVSGPRAHPEWTICGYPMEYPVLTQRTLSSISSDISSENVDLCSSWLEKTELKKLMTDATWLKLNQQCHFNIHSQGSSSKALEVILAPTYAYMIREEDSIPNVRSRLDWRGRLLCRDFTDSYFPGWTGEDCSIYCLSGEYDATSNECLCSTGFWSSSCDKICPYARDSPCGGGTCDNGICTCSLDRYAVTSNCKECSDGWIGSDCCTISAILSSAVKRMAMIFSRGHIVMFDGQGYDIHTPGQYILLENSEIGLYGRMKPRGENVCLQQLWLQINEDHFTVQTPLIDNGKGELIFWLNNEVIEIIDSETITGTVELEWEDQASFTINLASYGSMMLRVTYIGSCLDVQVIFGAATCSGSVSGLLGNCNQNMDDDFYSSDSTTVSQYALNQHLIDTSHVSKFKKEDITGFVYYYEGVSLPEPVTISNGYSLLFNDWGIMSAPVPKAVFNGTNITLDIKMKLSSDNGLILGYSFGSQFSIFVENLKLNLRASDKVYTTNFTFTKDQWTHIFITHDISSDDVAVSIFEDSVLTYQDHRLIASLALQAGGHFLLGHWQVASPADFGKLNGMIGTFRVWNKILDDYVMFDASVTHIVAGYESLVLLFEFNEGLGYETTDSVNGLGMSLPKTGEVTWFITDLPKVPKASEECKVETEVTLKLAANYEKCVSMLKSEHLTSVCVGLGTEFDSSYFYDACLTDETYVSSLKAKIDYYSTVISLTAIKNQICIDGTTEHYKYVCSEFCNFGTPTKSGCKCHKGYWGETCNDPCPGGSDNPCSGNGICNVTTGTCTCLKGFSLPDCATCEEMFMPVKCDTAYPPTYNPEDNSVDETAPVNTICSISSMGYVINYMQLSYYFNHIGQFYLVKPDSDNDKVPDIQICTTNCYCGKACITAMYLNYKSESISVKGASSSTGDVIVTINDDLQHSSIATTGLETLEIQSSSETQYIIKSLDNEINIIVSYSSSDPRFLDVVIRILSDTDLCSNQASICGNCTNFAVGMEFSTYESWIVQDGDKCVTNSTDGNVLDSTTGTGGSGGFASIFIDTPTASIDTSEGDSSGTKLSSDILKDVITNQHGIAISMKIKPKKDNGTIFTYSYSTVFHMFLENGLLKFSVGNQVFDSDIPIPIPNDEWHHISLVWSNVNEQMIVYATSLTNGSETENAQFLVPKEAFSNYGILSLGSYNSLFNPDLIDPIKQDLVGEMDEFFVFKRYLEASEEAKYRYDPVPLDEEGLGIYFNFDNVIAGTVKDLVSGNDLTAQTPSWKEPTVTFSSSDLPINQISEDEQSCISEYTAEVLTAATDTCTSYYSNSQLITLCDDLVDIDMHRRGCILKMQSTGEESTALDDVLTYAEKCNLMQEMNNETESVDVKQFLCSFNNVATGYAGVDCDILCKFPDPQGDGLNCSCATGYYGDHCDQVCPGGAENPCNGNGECNKLTGICKCLSNYQGDSCDTCSSGWLGKDCKITIQPSLPGSNFYSCSMTSYRHLTTFDGSSLPLKAQRYGTFMLYKDASLKIEIQIGSCSDFDLCVIAIAFESGNSRASIVPRENGVVRYNGNEVIIDGSLSLSLYRLKHPSTAYFLLEKMFSGFSVKIFVQQSYLSISISSQSCPVSSVTAGICGGCGSQSSSTCVSNDALCGITYGGIAQTITTSQSGAEIMTAIGEYNNQFQLNYEESIFASNGESPLTSGYGIELTSDDSYISFPTFGEEIFSNPDGRALEIRGEFETADGGTVFSYKAGEKTFGVVIEDGKFVIRYGNETYPTGISVVVGEPCNIGISYNVQTGEVVLDYIYGDSNIHSYAVIETIGTGALDAGGTLVVGQWSSYNTPPPPGHSIFTVDRVSIWDKFIKQNQFVSNWQVNKASEEPGLSGVYNLDEGSGTETKDSLTGNVATIDEASSWTESEIYIVPESEEMSDSSDTVAINEMAEAACGELRDILSDQCSQLSESLNSMFANCYEDVTHTGNSEAGLAAALPVATECSELLNIENPLKSLCNGFPGEQFQGWTGLNCDVKCDHGTYTTDNGCECDIGYYGDDCSGTCPGGPVPPCSGHGTCTIDGKCSCDPAWDGDDICSSCGENYTPSGSCDDLVVIPPNNCAGNKCSMKGGKVYQLDCTQKTYNTINTDLTILTYGGITVTVSIF